jgi:hypothetical protein
MGENIATLDYSIRWKFDDENRHNISEKTLTQSEKAFFDYIKKVAKISNIEIDIQINARKKGSFLEDFQIIINSQELKTVGTLLVGAAAQYFFSKKQVNAGVANSNIDSIIKLKDAVQKGILSESECEEIIKNEKGLKKYSNSFFQTAKSDNSITGLEVKSGQKEILNEKSENFGEYIFESGTSDTEIKEAKIFIISPVIVRGSKERWSGEYDGEKIFFYVKDKEFLNDAQSKKIQFDTGYYINCELEIIEEEDNDKIKLYYNVKKVLTCGNDPYHEFIFNHKAKVPRVDPNQGSVFDFIEGGDIY